MAAKKTEATKDASAESSGVKPAKKKKPADGTRETVESIAIAFVLAFLFKTFQAEAYVIPTGSMAPTLLGRHKEIVCEGCGYSFSIGASSEVDQSSGRLIPNQRISRVTCVNCGKMNENAGEASVFNGDRILVNKQIDEYKRFDVVVFKNPEQPHVNYIKRLVGLPGETIRVRKGDIWALKPGETGWQILRKDDPSIQKDIQLTVYDDQYPAKELLAMGWPERWVASTYGAGPESVGNWLPSENSWTADREQRTYKCDAAKDEFEWLRYRNFQPNPSSWPQSDQASAVVMMPQASLIEDFCSFNSFPSNHQRIGLWTGDLTINASVSVENVSAGAELLLELVEGPQVFQCQIDLTTGTATLQYFAGDDRQTIVEMATAPTAMTSVGSYDVSFANVDDRLCLWIDGRLAEFDRPTEYVSSDVPQPGTQDLAPVGIAVRNATAVVSDLLLQRDIYYRNDVIQFTPDDQLSVLDRAYSVNNFNYTATNSYQRDEVNSSLLHLLTNPSAWSAQYAHDTAQQLSSFGDYGDYKLADDEYLMFGDNSSMSKDSRLFDYETRPMSGIYSHRYAVRERDLIGKALFIFWPHGVPFLNDGKGIPVWYHKDASGNKVADYPSISVPFYPNLSRMKKIR